MEDSEVVNASHCSSITQLGIKAKVYDCDFLMALVDLINTHGPTITLG